MFYIFPLCLGHESLWPQGIKPPDKTQRKSLIKIIENPKGILNIKIQLDPFNFRGVGGVLHYRGCPYSILVYALCGYRVFPLKTESARKRNFCSIFQFCSRIHVLLNGYYFQVFTVLFTASITYYHGQDVTKCFRF